MNMLKDMQNLLTEYDIRRITKENYMQVMEVFYTNEDFFIQTEGIAATIEGCLSNIDSVPPDFSIDNKYYLGFWENGRNVAVLDVLLGFPLQSCVWIGLLLVHKELQSKQTGSKIVNAIRQASETAGFNSIQLGVIDNNTKGLNFWRKLGFNKIRESTANLPGRENVKIVVMELLL